MLPKSLFVALLFAVYFERSFEAPDVKHCRSDQQCFDTVNADNKLKQGIVIFIVNYEKDSVVGNIMLRFFDDKPVEAIFKVDVQSALTTAYLIRNPGIVVQYPFVRAMKNNRVLLPLVDKNQLNNLNDLLENALNPNGEFIPGYNNFTTDIKKRIEKYKFRKEKSKAIREMRINNPPKWNSLRSDNDFATKMKKKKEQDKIRSENSKRKRETEIINPDTSKSQWTEEDTIITEFDTLNISDSNTPNQINFPAATIARGNKQREKEISNPQASKSQWTEENTLWAEFDRMSMSESNTLNQMNLPATTIDRGTSQTSPKPASPEEHDAKRRRGKWPV